MDKHAADKEPMDDSQHFATHADIERMRDDLVERMGQLEVRMVERIAEVEVRLTQRISEVEVGLVARSWWARCSA